MTEEEISEKINYFNQHEINVSDEESEKIVREVEKVINEIIDLYHELKEKNASLQKEIKLMKSININDNYISKNEIRERITQLELLDKEYYKEVIILLEKLLEEE